MLFPSYIHDAVPLDDRRLLVLRSNPNNQKPGLLELWDVVNGERHYQVSAGATLAYVLAGRGALAASGDTDGAIRIWHIEDGRALRVIDTRETAQARSVGVLAFLDDDRLLAAPREQIAIWDIRNGTRLRSIPMDRASARALTITSDGERIVAACDDRCVRVIDVASGRCLAALLEPDLPSFAGRTDAQDPHTATGVDMLSDDVCVASYGDGTLRCWDLGNGDLVRKTRTTGSGPHWLLSVSAAPDGRSVIAGSWDANVWLWDLHDAPVPLAGHIGEAGPVSFLDDRTAVSVSFDQTIRVWDVVQRTCVRVIGAAVTSRRFPPDVPLW